MFEGHDQTVFDLLAEKRPADDGALRAAFAAHRSTGKSFARTVVDLGLVEGPAVLESVAHHLGCAWLPQLPSTLPDDAVAALEPALARTYGVAPLALDRESLTVAAVDPFNPNLVSDLTFALERDIRVTVADPERVQSLIRLHYGEDDASLEAILEELKAQASESRSDAGLTETDLAEMAGRTPIIRFVNLVLAQAIRERASDIHFEPFENEFRVRCRVDGALRELAPPPKSLALPILSRLKVLGNVNIAERRMPQDGRIRLTFAGRAVDLRLSTLPTQFGESIVLRVLDQSATRLELEEIGLPVDIRERVEEVLRRPNGTFIVTGPTGSGKTTTLYSCLKRLNTADVKILGVEDPVEYEVDGVMQVPVNLAAGLTFAKALRTFLRQDPDVVMVGEIRDAETGRIAIQASLTGHLVLTTLHTNDATSAVTRLVDMGLEPFLLASTVEAVLAQRLLRRICTACRESVAPTDALLRQLEIDSASLEGRTFHRGAGCDQCHQTGYRGRVGLFEFLRLSDALREKIVAGVPLVDLRATAQREGLVPLRAAGIEALLTGQTTAEEVLKYT